MKKLTLTLIIATTFGANLFAASNTMQDERLCKVFQDKATTYKKTMRSDEYAMKTLISYEKRADLYCSK